MSVISYRNYPPLQRVMGLVLIIFIKPSHIILHAVLAVTDVVIQIAQYPEIYDVHMPQCPVGKGTAQYSN